MIIRSFLLLFIFSYQLFGCATCALMVPTVEVNIKLHVEEKRADQISFTWKFSDIYTDELTKQYDKNKNNILDKDEIKTVLKIKNNYLQNKNMLTNIKLYDPKTDQETLIHPKYENFKLNVKDKNLIYTFDATTDIDVKDKNSLSFAFSDNEGFFSFITTGLSLSDEKMLYRENLYLFTATVLFGESKPKEIKKVEEKKLYTDLNQTKPTYKLTQENILKKSIERIKKLFESIKDESNPLSYISLLFFAYMYGIIHALGPGHGKTLVASYFLTNDKSYTKALFISIAIGVVHTFSAFLLTLAIYYFLDVLFAQFVDNAVYYTTKVSALIIITIALYLLYKKHKAYKELQSPSFTFSPALHPSTCGCGSCKVDKDSTDTALIISAGIIPCPGTITIFIFSLSLGLYYAGFLSALVMSIGMSTIIFFSAIMSVYFRKKTTNTNIKLKKALEYTSLFIILSLGVVLLF